MKMKLPLKFRILQIICEKSIQVKRINTCEIIDLIKLEYGNEKQCNPKTITTHILALKAVGLIEELDVHEINNELISEYKANHEGFKRMSLMPNYAESYNEWVPFKRQAMTLIHSN